MEHVCAAPRKPDIGDVARTIVALFEMMCLFLPPLSVPSLYLHCPHILASTYILPWIC